MRDLPSHAVLALLILIMTGASPACGGGNEAQKHGVGAACGVDGDCTETGQVCLAFKGGYCGIADCALDVDCPGGSACVAHTDGRSYCFLVCSDKAQCNRSRSADAEANCSSNITFTSGNVTAKACVPPSG